ESVVKVVILSAAGLFAIYGVFGGFNGLDEWLRTSPSALTGIDIPFLDNSTNLVILLFFTAIVAMPHMLHMIFRENSNAANLKIASWGFPLLLLIVAVPVLPLLWAAAYLESTAPVDFSGLVIGMLHGYPGMTLLVFIGG